MTISIHQPNFFPWYPFFQKVEKSQKFILLNQSQFQKNNLQNRFSMDDKWYTISVNRGLDPIFTKKYLSPTDDWERIKKSLPEYKKILEKFDPFIGHDLKDTNTNIIKKICDIIEVDTEILSDYPTELKASERILDICLKFEASTYISGISGKKYLDLEIFKKNGIEVFFQKEEEMIKEPILKILKKYV
jgi:hypothetical protein